MKEIKQCWKWVNGPYADFWLRLLLAFVAGHYIVFHGTNYGFFAIVKVGGYVPSLIASSLIAFILVMFVYWTTIYLDRNITYHSNWKKRLFLQGCLGGVGVGVIAYYAALFYFELHDVDRRTTYLKYDYPMIVGFIIGLNVYYFIYDLLRTKEKLRSQNKVLERTERQLKMQVLDLDELNAKPNDLGVDSSDIACICVSNKNYEITYLNGKKFAWFKALSSTLKELDPANYFMINRDCIIHRTLIESYSPLSSRRLKLKLKVPFDALKNENLYKVSQLYARKFISWYNDIDAASHS